MNYENLRNYQIEDLNKILPVIKEGGGSFLIASEVGTGKTRIACAAAMEVGSQVSQVLIVAPLSTFGGWLSEAEAVGLPIAIASALWPDTQAVLINYEKLDKFEQILNINKKFSLIIFDEAHKLKSPKSDRHKVWEKLRRKNNTMLYLTATPGQDPLDLRYLCGVIDFELHQYWSWVRSFKGIYAPHWGGLKFRNGHIEDTRRLSKLLSENPRALRRTPQDIAGWPELERVIYPVKLTEPEWKDYVRSFEYYLDERETLGKRRHTKADVLVAVGQFRKALSLLKVPYTIELAKDLIEQGKVVAISCQYLAPTQEILEGLSKFRVGVITGEVSSEERIQVLESSKKDELDVIIFSVVDGINLHQFEDHHRPRIQIDHDVRWSALEQHQLDGRCHRAGRSALVYWLSCAKTVDIKVAQRLKERMETLGAITGDVDFGLEEILDAELPKDLTSVLINT